MYLPSETRLHNRYVIEAVLGMGGFGITYLATDSLLNVKAAVKEYLPRQLATRLEGQTQVTVYTGEARNHYDYGLKRFLEEAQALAQFAAHPNIVACRDFFTENGTAYLVMHYIDGVTLKEYLGQRGGKIPFETAYGIMMPVMDALREVHQASLLHRDISPDNIFLTTTNQVKLIDFGAARYQAGEQSRSLSVILKPGFAPEEQYRSSGKQGPWTDVYAVAATLYKTITGQQPPEALDRLAEDNIAPPSRLGVRIPASAEAALMKALAVQATQRFQTMQTFQAALSGESHVEQRVSLNYSRPIAGSSSLPSRSSTKSRQGTNRGFLYTAAVMGLAIIGGLIWWQMQPSQTETAVSAVPPPVVQETSVPAPLASPPPAENKEYQVAPAPVNPPPPTISPAETASNYLAEGRTLYEEGKFAEAGQKLQSSLQHQPDLAESHYLLASSHLRNDNPLGSELHFKKAIELNHNLSGAYDGLGQAYWRLARIQEAIAAWKESLRLQPDHLSTRYQLATAYLATGNVSLAQEEHANLKGYDQGLADELMKLIKLRLPPSLETPAAPPQTDKPPQVEKSPLPEKPRFIAPLKKKPTDTQKVQATKPKFLQ